MSAQAAKEATRAEFRVRLFMRRGWDASRARSFADRLRTRDAERDDRRACIECTELQRKGTCFPISQGRMSHSRRDATPVQDLLQRCEFFKFQTP